MKSKKISKSEIRLIEENQKLKSDNELLAQALLATAEAVRNVSEALRVLRNAVEKEFASAVEKEFASEEAKENVPKGEEE